METRSFNHILSTVAKLYEKGLYKQAIELLNELCENNPENDDLFFKLGFLYSKNGDYVQSAEAYEKAISINPNKFEYYYNCGIVCTNLGKIDKAINYFNKALEFTPNDINTLYNLGCALKKGNNYQDALAYFNKVLSLNNSHSDALYNIGVILYEQQNFQKAKEYFLKTIDINPKFADAYWNLSLIYLREGNYKEGFNLYYWRWDTYEFKNKRKSYKIPLTNLKEISHISQGARILVSYEQGFGDTIQFLRLLTLLKQKYQAKIAFQTKPELFNLLKSFKDIDELFTVGQYIEKPDYHFTIMDIPTLLNISVDDIKYHYPYLQPSKSIQLKKEFPYNIGFCLSGNANHKLNHIRNISLDSFKHLFKNPNIGFWNLSLEKYNLELPNYRETNFNDFDELASIMQQMDLIVSVDTATIHLAGALNIPAVLLLPEFTDWRWELANDTTPYYDSITILRKKTNWDDLISNELQNYISSKFNLANDFEIQKQNVYEEETYTTSTPSGNNLNQSDNQNNNIVENQEQDENIITNIENVNNQQTNEFLSNDISSEQAITNDNNTISNIPAEENLDRTIINNIPTIPTQNDVVQDDTQIVDQQSAEQSDDTSSNAETSTNDIFNKINEAINIYKNGNLQTSLEIFDNLLKDNHQIPEIYYNYALIQYELKNYQKAIENFEQALTLLPDNENIIIPLAKLYILTKDKSKTKTIREKITNITNSFEKYFTLGIIDLFLEDYQQAKDFFENAYKYNPNNEELLLNLGYVNFKLKNFVAATDFWTKLLEINPKNKQAYFNLGQFFEETKFYTNALECYQRAIEIDYNYAEARFSAAEMYLMLQHFQIGWQQYEYRKYLEKYPKYPLKGAEWKGEDISNKTLLVYDEQGIGDSLQFVRYIKNITAKKIILATRTSLIDIYKYSFPDVEIKDLNEISKLEYDNYVSLLSLPYIFNIVPDHKLIPYLVPEIKRLNKFLKFIDTQKLNILFVPKASGEIKEKDLDDNFIRKILQNPQYNILTYKSPFVDTNTIDLTNLLTNIADTLALISKMDLVVTVDTAVAHLAGSIGKRTILLLKFNADWRWFYDFDYSLFYPNFTILRQKEYNNWNTIYDKLIEILAKFQQEKNQCNDNFNNFLNALDNSINEAQDLYNKYSTYWLNDYNKYHAIIAYLTKIDNSQKANILLSELKTLFPENKKVTLLEAIKSEISNNTNDAIENYYKLLEKEPNNNVYKLNLANLLSENNQNDKAIELYEAIIQDEPSNIIALNNLANLYQKEMEYQKSLKLYQDALSLEPNNVEILYNYGSLLQILGNFNEAISCFRQVLRLDFNYYRAHFNLSTILLTQGNFVEGFNEYEYRRILPEFKYTNLDIPYWNGENLNNKKILIITEQGLGDTINFVRFLKFIKEKYPECNITLQTNKSLIPLLEKLDYIDNIFTFKENIDYQNYDYYTYILSILRFFIDKIYHANKYDIFDIPPKEIDFPTTDKIKIGICWRGSQKHKHTKIRDLALNEFIFLTEKPYNEKYQIYSLQIDITAEEEILLKNYNIIDLRSIINDFYDTYSILTNLDIVITVDTSILHLAASTGKPRVYAYIPFFNDWRWLNGSNPNIWYKNLTLLKNFELDSTNFIQKSLKGIL